MICIYHNKDLDGYCSGVIVKLKYPDAKLIGYDYGQPFPWNEIPTNTPVIMIDVSLPMDDMRKLSYHTDGQLTWVDHHASAIKDYKEVQEGGNPFKCDGVLENGIAACEGGWKYLFPDKQMPTAVKLLGEYDTWRNQDKKRWDNAIVPFQYGMRMICSSPETFPKELFSEAQDIAISYADAYCNKICENGRLILTYQKTQNERACKSSFEITFEGLRAICLNNGGANSQVFESVWDENKHDVMIPFVFTGKHWTFSLYTTKDEVDCSVIAKSKGGGGHKKAAGFKLKELPDEFKIHVYESTPVVN
jgi:oligoribonuclease NrnB/cAMP/cGMP phosphodiesterase (DHH superfamily)